jgi:uncharacterized protein YqeY
VASDLKSRLQDDLNSARKQRDRALTLVLSTVFSDVKNREIDSRAPLSDDDVVQVLNRAIKQRREAAEQMRAAGRTELADKEESEVRVLTAYLPQQMTEEDVRALVRSAIAEGASQMGALMAKVMPAVRGRFDGKEANRIAREELGG